MGKLKAAFSKNLKQFVMLIALVVIIVFFQVLTRGTLLKPMNVFNLINQNAYVVILAAGMLICILTGGNIDLSVGSVVAFVGACAGTFMITWKWDPYLSVALCLLIGLAIGMWHGFWIAVIKVHPWITTLAGELLFRGLAQVILNGRSIGPVPEAFQFLATGFFPDIIPGAPRHMLTILLGAVGTIVFIASTLISNRRNKRMGLPTTSMGLLAGKIVLISLFINALCYVLSGYKGASFAMLLLIVLVLIFSFITKKSVFGRHLYAMGGNIKAARLSGINTSRLMFTVYTISSFMATVAGILVCARATSATPKAGINYETDAIAACFLGGASISGGAGTVFGVLVGALIMGVLNNGMSLLGVSIDWQSSIKGLVVLVAVAFDMLFKNRQRG